MLKVARRLTLPGSRFLKLRKIMLGAGIDLRERRSASRGATIRLGRAPPPPSARSAARGRWFQRAQAA